VSWGWGEKKQTKKKQTFIPFLNIFLTQYHQTTDVNRSVDCSILFNREKIEECKHGDLERSKDSGWVKEKDI